MNAIEHADITNALLTGYPRGNEPPRVVRWLAQEVRHEDAFPYVPHEEREDD